VEIISTASLQLLVDDGTQVADARRAVTDMCRGAGWTEPDVARAALVVTEVATNLVKHAGGGRLVVRRHTEHAGRGIEILALDRGPGIERIDRCLRDGYSTAGSPGTGLGAISRHADVLDIYSQVGGGTAMLVRIRPADDRAVGDDDVDLGAVCVPKTGETACGDGWAMRHGPHGRQLLVVDGLGHGPLAAAAAQEALRIFLGGPARSPGAVLETLHGGLRDTRGAVAGLAEIDVARNIVTFAGIGNVAASVVAAGGAHSLVSHNGTLGQEVRRFQEFPSAFAEDALLVLHSDGLRHQWHLNQYAGLEGRHPALIAGVLYRDFGRERDDVTVIVVRRNRRESVP
jgi:anti-sigma regulatory factor (Ser/Thr protein kinase)